MKKKILLTSIVGAIALGLGIGVASYQKETVATHAAEAVIDVPAGIDVRGGVHLTCTAGTDKNYEVLLLSMMDQNTEGDMLYMRVRNNVSIETPLSISVRSGNSGQYSITQPNLKYYLYDAFGCNEVEQTYLYTTNIQIPSWFDGIVGIPLSNYTGDNWGKGAPNWSLVWMLDIATQPLYNPFTDITFGDIFNSAGLNFDSSELNADNWNAYVGVHDGSDGVFHTVQDLKTDFNPTGKDLAGGIEVNVTNNYTTVDVCDNTSGENPKQINGSFIWLRIRNFQADAWIRIQIMGCEGCNNVPGNNKPFYYYDVNGNHVATYNSSAYEQILLPADFDGFIGVPLASLDNITAAPIRTDWLYGIFVSGYTGAHFVIGDVFGFNQSATGVQYTAMLRDSSTTTFAKYNTLRNSGDLSKTRIYPGFADDEASTFAEQFLGIDCTDYTNDDWDLFSLMFIGLSEEMQNYIAETDYSTKTDNELNIVEKAVQRYDLAVVRQSRTQFIAARTVSNYQNALSLYTGFQMDSYAMLIICIALITSIGACLIYFKKRKEQK